MADQMRALERAARQQGWTITRAGSGRVHWRNPDGGLVIAGKDDGQARAIQNLTARLRRTGLRLPRKDGRR